MYRPLIITLSSPTPQGIPRMVRRERAGVITNRGRPTRYTRREGPDRPGTPASAAPKRSRPGHGSNRPAAHITHAR